MKNILLITFICLFSSIVVSGQTKEEKIKQTEAKAEAILADSGLSVLTLLNEEFMPYVTDGGGELKIFYKGDTLLMLREQIGLSYGILTTTYFLDDNKMLLVRETEDAFPMKEGSEELDFANPKRVFDGSYYFDGSKLLDIVKNGKRTFDEELYFDSQTKEGVLISSLEQYRSLFNKLH